MNNNSIFSYLKPEDNDNFSNMSGLDLQELLYYLEFYYLKLRHNLGLSNDITFGLELEFENAKIKPLEQELKASKYNEKWFIKNEPSVIDGAEINSPVLKDTNASWISLKKICHMISEYATIDAKAGGHIHIGTQVLGNNPKSWLNFIKFWSVYENVIYRFSYGEFLNARQDISSYASPASTLFWYAYEDLKPLKYLDNYVIISKINYARCKAVNFKKVTNFTSFNQDNTIEFRCPNGTLNPIIWQNNVNLFVNILLYAKNSLYNDDIIEQRKEKNGEKYNSLIWYKEIFLEQALELCDMLFNTNLDKIYFLKQYLKSFETSEDKIKAKPFTRSLRKKGD